VSVAHFCCVLNGCSFCVLWVWEFWFFDWEGVIVEDVVDDVEFSVMLLFL